MDIIIEEAVAQNIGDVNQCDGEFVVDSKLVLSVENGSIRYTIVPVPSTSKRYEADDIDYRTYLHDPDKAVLLAYVGGRIAGQIILRKNWNTYAYLEDIAVDKEFRKSGIGKRLMLQAKRWAHTRNLAGIMLETQNNNVNACLFYERCGFQLRGFDTHLYKGIKNDTDEIALFWYFTFEDMSSPSV